MRSGVAAPVPSVLVSDALDRLVASTESGPLPELSMQQLRARRSELQSIELALSYVRRLIQGRLDIVLDERHHRAAGEGGRNVAALVADLPKILSEHVAGGGRGALPEVTLPPADLDEIVAVVDHIIDAARLGSMGELSDAALDTAATELTDLERRVSQHRRSLHASIDALQEEIVRRYKTGEASVDALLH
jgi:anti-sigma-K factor RsiG